jgi:hypothetical protein
VTRETKAFQVHKVRKESKVLLETKETKVLQAQSVHQVQRVQQVLLAIRETKVFKESLATKVSLV